MGYILKDKKGNTLAKLIQFVATDEQVNVAITQYLDENGIHLAEGVDLKKMDSNIEENKSGIAGLKESVENLKKAQNNVLLEYKDHFFDNFEYGAIDNETGSTLDNASYARSSDYKKIETGNSVLIANIPEGYQCAYYFYDPDQKFQGATEWMQPSDVYQISESQVGWYVKSSIYSSNKIDLHAINIILAGSAVNDIINALKENNGKQDLLGEEDLSTADQLELNVTKAAIESSYNSNCALIPFFTDLHISCTANQTASEIAKSAAKIKRHLACYNVLSESIKADLVVYGGDYLNNSAQTNKQTALEAHKAVRLLMDKTVSLCPAVVGKGNHDDNTMYTDYKNGYVNSDTLYRLVTNKDADSSKRNTDYLEKSYGYYDIPNKKIRVFMLNSDDVPTNLDESTNKLTYGGQNTSGFSQDQLQFVADNLVFKESGWQVLFFSHHPLMAFVDDDTEAKGYTCNGVVQNNGGKAMLDLLSAFQNKEKGTLKNSVVDFEISVTYDFTENKSNTIIASVCGHTHVYCHKLKDGIHYIATRAILGHPTYQYISTSYYIVIDRKKRTIKLIANGDGEDYQYEY